MTLLMAEGFDLIATADLATKWSIVQNNPANGGNITTGGRISGNKFRCSADITFNSSTLSGALGLIHPAKTTVVAGFACQFFGGPATQNDMFSFLDTAGGYQGRMAFNTTTNVIDVYRGNYATLICSGSTTMSQNRFYYVEIKWVLDPTAGSVILRLDGVQVASFTGNTQQTGNHNIGQTWVGQVGGMSIGNTASHINYRIDFDDIYICDTLGTVNNDFLGDLRVYGILPDNSATYTQFNRVGASATNWQSVNENPNNGDTTYVTNNLVGTVDTYMFQNLPADAATVIAVIGEPVTRKDDVGYRTIGTHIRMPSGSEGDAPTTTPVSSVYTIPEHIMETNPATAAPWSVTDVNTMEVGPKIAA